MATDRHRWISYGMAKECIPCPKEGCRGPEVQCCVHCRILRKKGAVEARVNRAHSVYKGAMLYSHNDGASWFWVRTRQPVPRCGEEAPDAE